MRILVDMDGVIVDFEAWFLARWQALHPDKPYIEIKNRTLFYVSDEYPIEYRKFVHAILQEKGFFENMPPVPGGIQALREMEQLGWEVFICTSPLIRYENCVVEKFAWVEKHLGAEWVGKLILTSDKTIIQGDFLIDDNPKITGAESNPTWEHLVYAQAYNRQVQNRRRLTWDNWKTVLLENS